MTLWTIVLAASVACLGLKLLGYAIPPRLFEPPPIRRSTELLPAALLAGLIVTQTFSSGQQLEADARLAGLGVAAVLYAVRAPFLVAVVSAAAVTALLRLVQP
ncbi:MAG: AzlD domain-containing protein [Micrococcales bacterium]|nr:AzlD domain-containing protein [Micrococcales bacterium]